MEGVVATVLAGIATSLQVETTLARVDGVRVVATMADVMVVVGNTLIVGNTLVVRDTLVVVVLVL